MWNSDRFANESLGLSGGLTPPTVPPEDPFDPRSHWLAPRGKTKARRGARGLAVLATVAAFIAVRSAISASRSLTSPRRSRPSWG
jgi:hypothetical protein